ncbi:hypothetical protein CEXT_555471 [Caerostris extrusa]|uniref:Uncharacterized protein n=1 Tax=Caerostris extrusa TaxID=172846 RepID=A0AAV4YA59_CAEEX|nr:hypothetical protein CEXT_555471 [Caerostris extrusa]
MYDAHVKGVFGLQPYPPILHGLKTASQDQRTLLPNIINSVRHRYQGCIVVPVLRMIQGLVFNYKVKLRCFKRQIKEIEKFHEIHHNKQIFQCQYPPNKEEFKIVSNSNFQRRGSSPE